MPIAPKPKKREPVSNLSDEQKAMDFIRQGGGLPQKPEPITPPRPGIYSKGRHTTKTDPNDEVSISIKLLVSERNKINEFRSERSARKKISLQDWIIEAVTEKIEREEKRRNRS
ncbi:hypothetical protein ACFQ4C_30480 [Larkinella insperata]|uniref:CopG family transcriptional regulator n=1 Tax=Larkinella insperata TaxID=332158 RepID=A0ABW3QHA0_9BACT